ncbi:MAG: VOC family protein [Akkermansiaceae bacterium]
MSTEPATAPQPTVSISLTCLDASEAIDFYTRAFGAEELFRMPDADGSVAHAEFMIGNTRLFISGEAPEMNAFALPEGTMAPCLFCIATDDCDAAYTKAMEAGGKSLSEPEDQFWGSRSAMILDDYGYRWTLVQQIEDLTPEEIGERAKKLFG